MGDGVSDPCGNDRLADFGGEINGDDANGEFDAFVFLASLGELSGIYVCAFLTSMESIFSGSELFFGLELPSFDVFKLLFALMACCASFDERDDLKKLVLISKGLLSLLMEISSYNKFDFDVCLSGFGE